MPGLRLYKNSYYQNIGANQPILEGTIKLGCTKGRGSSTRMFNYCKQTSQNPSSCIDQFINIPKQNDCDLLSENTNYQTCGPWPQFGGLDNTNSRYTPILASQNGKIQPLYIFEDTLFSVNTSPSIANDGTIYIGYNQLNIETRNPSHGYLFAFNNDGTVKWQYILQSNDTFNQSTPTIGKNGVIYFGSKLGYVYAINPNGTTKWYNQYTLGIYNLSPIIGSITASLIIGNDNNIYFGSNGVINPNDPYSDNVSLLFSIKSRNGTENWTYNPFPQSNNNRPSINDSVAIDKNNNIYFGFQLNNNGQLAYVICLDSYGVLKWQTDINHSKLNSVLLTGRPTLSVDNSYVYIPNFYYQSTPSIFYLNAIKTIDGTIDNQKSITINCTNSNSNYNSIARNNNDDLYFSICDPSNNAVLYSVKNGTINWTFTINAPIGINTIAYIDNTPSIGSDGTIYFCVTSTDYSTYTSSSSMYAINQDGTLKWDTPIIVEGGFSYVYTSSAINLQGNVIISATIFNIFEGFPANYHSTLYSFM